jgi:pimeloyl-ACP methyl ester carboxylesterase
MKGAHRAGRAYARALALILCFSPYALAQDEVGDQAPYPPSETVEIAGLHVAVWRPPASPGERPPLIVYSPGFTACKTDSSFLTSALARAGYLVVAPDHRDSACSGVVPPPEPEAPFSKPQAWTDNTYRQRGRDIAGLIAALNDDGEWSAQFDASRIGLLGHSLGGYTVLSVAGARASWRIDGIRAVVAAAPLIGPLLYNGSLDRIGAPVMYQTGSKDAGTATLVKKPGGAFDKTKDSTLVEFAGASHFAWGDGAANLEGEIAAVTVAFFDAKLRGKAYDPPQSKSIALYKAK